MGLTDIGTQSVAKQQSRKKAAAAAKADSTEQSEATLESTGTQGAQSPTPTELVADTKPAGNIDRSEPTNAGSESKAIETDANDQARLEAKEQIDVEAKSDLESKTIVKNAEADV